MKKALSRGSTRVTDPRTFVVIVLPLVCQALEMMKEAGVRPNTYCMNSVMGVSVQARQPNTALEIFKEMEKDGIPRDVVSAYVRTVCRPPLRVH